MRRRDFLALAGVGAAAAAWPLAARAQQQRPVPRAPGGRPWAIGVISNQTKPQSDLEFEGPFRKGMADLGYVEGRDYSLEERYNDGDTTRNPAIAKELVGLALDLIVVSGSAGAAAAVQQLTITIPIVSSGIQTADLDLLIGKNLAQPVGNVTGIAGENDSLAGKHCELALELVPGAKRIGVLVGTGGTDGGKGQRDAVAAAANALKFTLVMVDVTQPAEVAAAFRSLADARVDAAVVGAGGIFSADRAMTVAAAAAVKLPALYNQVAYVEAGGLISYSGDRRATSARLASFVDQILRGAKPGDLPVEQISNFTMAINLKTAKALGLTIPPTVLLRADRVIE